MAEVAERRVKLRIVGVLGALLALALLGAASLANPTSVDAGGEFPAFSLSSSFSPKALSRSEPTPIKLKLSGKFRALTGSGQPPAVRELRIESDRSLAITTKGLPRCAVRGVQAQGQAAAPGGLSELCRPAQIGRGTAEISLLFNPGEEVQHSTVKVSVYNSVGKNGSAALLAYAVIPVPAPEAIVAEIEFKRIDAGRYGGEARVRIPKIAGGSGAIESFELTIGKQYIYKDKRRRVFTLKCINGTIFTRAEATFANGSGATSEEARTCVKL